MIQAKETPYWERFKQQLEAMPTMKTEESIPLRFLVQALVTVGILATDVATQNYWSLWAVPLSIVGAWWSWKNRHKRNITMKFILAIGMIAMLVFFFGNLRENLNDTRLALAELLTQLQVLHSFDLPRRKDLGYSMVIGLILLGVAGTVSQTLAFAPLLVLFLALAIPTLILDYRSRLGLETPANIFSGKSSPTHTKGKNPLSLKTLSIFLGVILALGLIIFAVMPRFQGYRLQTFPVSTPVDLDSQELNSQRGQIVNPGYQQDNNRDGQNPGEGSRPGQVDSTYYYGFNQRINQNLRGEMTPEVVMRVRSQAPGFWRVLAFDRYTGQGWEISRNDKTTEIQRPTWGYRFFLPTPPIQGQTREVIQSFTVVSDLPNLIPALSYPRLLFFPTKKVTIDSEGGLRAPASLVEGLTYTVISDVPYRDRTILGKASQRYSPRMADLYLQISPELSEKIRPVAEQLLSKASKPLANPYEKALFLTQALKQNYEIITELPFFDKEEDLVEAFLFRYKGGYPDHFSTVLTMMLRSIGIPTRLAAGFAPGQFNPFTGFYVVKNTDAYALTEVYFPGYGWFAFDPIPGRDLYPPSFEEDQTFSVLKMFWNWIASWVPSPVAAFFSTLWIKGMEALLSFVVTVWGFVSGSIIGVLIGLVSLVILSLLLWLASLQVFKWLKERHLAKLPPMERIYQQMLGILSKNGYPKHPAQTPFEYAKSGYQNHNEAIASIIEEISQAYVAWRYGDLPPNLAYLESQLGLLRKNKFKVQEKV